MDYDIIGMNEAIEKKLMEFYLPGGIYDQLLADINTVIIDFPFDKKGEEDKLA